MTRTSRIAKNETLKNPESSGKPRRPREKAGQSSAGMLFPHISQVNVNVVNNIANYLPASDPSSTKEQHRDSSRVMASFIETSAETEKRSSPRQNRKERQE